MTAAGHPGFQAPQPSPLTSKGRLVFAAGSTPDLGDCYLEAGVTRTGIDVLISGGGSWEPRRLQLSRGLPVWPAR